MTYYVTLASASIGGSLSECVSSADGAGVSESAEWRAVRMHVLAHQRGGGGCSGAPSLCLSLSGVCGGCLLVSVYLCVEVVYATGDNVVSVWADGCNDYGVAAWSQEPLSPFLCPPTAYV